LKTIAAAMTVLVACTMAWGRSATDSHADGWQLALTCPAEVKKGKTCKMQVRLSFIPKGQRRNTVATGSEATVVLTIADKDTFSRDDVVLTRTYRFAAGQSIEFTERSLCGYLKKDLGRKSEIYAKVTIRASLKGVGKLPLIDYKATVKTPTIKVKTVK